ncbi:MAG TPA: hypothetical protein VFJ87_10865 [Rhodanobacteraceae bacterium]|nr:hypothetical protein [Rhodanobacteraceae bacterium]
MDDSASTPPTAASTHAEGTVFAHVFGCLTSAFGWLMCTLAAGAVAAFAAIVFDVRPCWSILVLALPLTLALKACGCMSTRGSAAIAVIAVLLAGFYASCLVAVARIAATTGYAFGEAFRTGGIGLTLQVAQLGLDALAVLVYAAAAVIAAAFATWLARPPSRH